MIDTNALSQFAQTAQQAAPVVQSTLNAWHVVALGAGAYLAHAYHSIKAAGGLKNIFSGLWDGGKPASPAAADQTINQKTS
jgi:hypothetical protein